MFGHKNFWSEKIFGWKKKFGKKNLGQKNCQAPSPPLEKNTSGRRSSQSAFGRSTGNDVSGH